MIQKIRNEIFEIFPRDEDKVFTAYFCAALDSTEYGFNLFRGQIKVPSLTTKGQATLPAQEAIILTNKPMPKQLSSSLQWSIGATLKIAPKGFRQILM